MLVFGGTVGAPFSQGEQGDGIERNRQGPLQAVIKPPETVAWVPIETYPLPRGEAFGHQDDR